MYIAPVTWITARCPACHDLLAEVDGGRLRKVCPRCRPKVLVTFDAVTGDYQLERVDGTALAVCTAPSRPPPLVPRQPAQLPPYRQRTKSAVERELGRTLTDAEWDNAAPWDLLLHEGKVTAAEVANVFGGPAAPLTAVTARH